MREAGRLDWAGGWPGLPHRVLLDTSRHSREKRQHLGYEKPDLRLEVSAILALETQETPVTPRLQSNRGRQLWTAVTEKGNVAGVSMKEPVYEQSPPGAPSPTTHLSFQAVSIHKNKRVN